MSPIRSLKNMKKALSVLDFGSETVAVLVGEKKEDGTFHILGAGDAPARGVENGEITNLGDAVESVVEAARKAERCSGVRVETVYYNFDDARIQSVRSKGSKQLAGEGEIRAQDVECARQTAERLVSHFEKVIVYSKEIGFLIDDRDVVDNPVGVFGRKLEVTMHILQARSEYCEAWQKLIKRANLGNGVRVFSCWSTAYGILPREDRKRKRLILDLGKDHLNFFIFENNVVSDGRFYLNNKFSLAQIGERASAALAELTAKWPDVKEVLVTGDLAQDEKMIQALKETISVPVRLGSPLWVPKLTASKYASIVGLLCVADELERKSPVHRRNKGLFVSAKEKAVSFINEYF